MVKISNTGISIVLGTFNRFDLLKLTIQSIREELQYFLSGHEIIVIDGGSTDGSLEWLIQQKDIITIVQHNRGEWLGKPIERKSWGYFMNLGFKAAQGKYICMISDDCLIIPGAIRNAVQLFEEKLNQKKKIGAIAFYYRNYPFDAHYFVQIPQGRMIINHGLYLKSALEKVNYIDETTYQFYFADADLSFRLWKAGFKIIDSPTSFIEHYIDEAEKIRSENSKIGESDSIIFSKRFWGITKYNSFKTKLCHFFKIRIKKTSIRFIEFSDPNKTAQKFYKIHA